MTDRENPFLIPPPPRREGAASNSPVDEPAAPEPDEAGPLISLPPGLVDSATLRGAQRTQRRSVEAPPTEPVRRSNDEIVFFPGAPGAPGAPGGTAVPDAGAPDAAPGGAPDDATVIRGAVPVPVWTLTLADGRAVPMPPRLLLGRNPAAVAGWMDAELLPLADPAKSVSKTHAALELVGDALWVHDLDSTNGVWISGAGVEEQQVTPGTRALVPAGADIELGELVIRAQRRPPGRAG